MSVWIVNASPLILLGKISRLHLLADLADEVTIPHEVAAEIKAGPANDPARRWLETKAQKWIAEPLPADMRVMAWDLGKGETSVISRALTGRQSVVCLLDDRVARDCARLFGMQVRGTVGVLLLAKQQNLIETVHPEIEALRRAGALLDESVIREALRLASED